MYMSSTPGASGSGSRAQSQLAPIAPAGRRRLAQTGESAAHQQSGTQPEQHTSGDDPRLPELLRGYHISGVTNSKIISELLERDYGINLSEHTVIRRRRALSLLASGPTTRTLTDDAKRQLVLEQMAKDPSGRWGPRAVKAGIFKDNGVHITRAAIADEMRDIDPVAYTSRGPSFNKGRVENVGPTRPPDPLPGQSSFQVYLTPATVEVEACVGNMSLGPPSVDSERNSAYTPPAYIDNTHSVDFDYDIGSFVYDMPTENAAPQHYHTTSSLHNAFGEEHAAIDRARSNSYPGHHHLSSSSGTLYVPESPSTRPHTSDATPAQWTSSGFTTTDAPPQPSSASAALTTFNDHASSLRRYNQQHIVHHPPMLPSDSVYESLLHYGAAGGGGGGGNSVAGGDVGPSSIDVEYGMHQYPDHQPDSLFHEGVVRGSSSSLARALHVATPVAVVPTAPTIDATQEMYLTPADNRNAPSQFQRLHSGGDHRNHHQMVDSEPLQDRQQDYNDDDGFGVADGGGRGGQDERYHHEEEQYGFNDGGGGSSPAFAPSPSNFPSSLTRPSTSGTEYSLSGGGSSPYPFSDIASYSDPYEPFVDHHTTPAATSSSSSSSSSAMTYGGGGTQYTYPTGAAFTDSPGTYNPYAPSPTSYPESAATPAAAVSTSLLPPSFSMSTILQQVEAFTHFLDCVPSFGEGPEGDRDRDAAGAAREHAERLVSQLQRVASGRGLDERGGENNHSRPPSASRSRSSTSSNPSSLGLSMWNRTDSDSEPPSQQQQHHFHSHSTTASNAGSGDDAVTGASGPSSWRMNEKSSSSSADGGGGGGGEGRSSSSSASASRRRCPTCSNTPKSRSSKRTNGVSTRGPELPVAPRRTAKRKGNTWVVE